MAAVLPARESPLIPRSRGHRGSRFAMEDLWILDSARVDVCRRVGRRFAAIANVKCYLRTIGGRAINTCSMQRRTCNVVQLSTLVLIACALFDVCLFVVVRILYDINAFIFMCS